MTTWVGKTYWLVGASEGLGEALAHKLSGSGAELVVSARSADKLAEVVAALESAGVHVLEGPVTRSGALGPLTSVYFTDPDGNLTEIATCGGGA